MSLSFPPEMAKHRQPHGRVPSPRSEVQQLLSDPVGRHIDEPIFEPLCRVRVARATIERYLIMHASSLHFREVTMTWRVDFYTCESPFTRTDRWMLAKASGVVAHEFRFLMGPYSDELIDDQLAVCLLKDDDSDYGWMLAEVYLPTPEVLVGLIG